MNESEDKVHTVYVRHNYYEGKHYDNGGRAYPVLAKSPEEAESIAKTHKDKIESHLRTLKVKSGNASRNLIAKSDKYRLKDEDIHADKHKPIGMFQSTHRNVIDRDGNFPNKKVNEMTDETINLIGAIASGDTIASAQMFGSALMSRISDMIDSRRQEVAQTMFANESMNEAAGVVAGHHLESGQHLHMLDNKHKIHLPVRVNGVTGNEKQYGEGGVKHKSVKDALRTNNVNSLGELEAKDNKHPKGYGHEHYLSLTANPGTKKEYDFHAYVHKGRWATGSGANKTTFYKPSAEHTLEESIQIDERYSDAYQFTHKPNDPESEKKLADLKASVKGTNKRVVLRGRLGKDNPNAGKYKLGQSRFPGNVDKEDAAHHDVYLYDKPKDWSGKTDKNAALRHVMGLKNRNESLDEAKVDVTSKIAADFSRKANRTNEIEDHLKAMKAHRQLAKTMTGEDKKNHREIADDHLEASRMLGLSNIHESNDSWDKLATDDFQKRGDKYPKGNVPDTIDHHRDGATFTFKNTDEKTAAAFAKSHMAKHGLKHGKITTSQSGDYHNDWVEVHVQH